MDEWVAKADSALDQDALISAVRKLIEIPSVHDPEMAPGAERPVADLICGWLEDWGMNYQRWDVEPGRPNIVVDINGSERGKTILFEGHMDVVTSGDRDLWSRDPFTAVIEDGRIFGRGAADMKGGLAAMIFAARAIQLSGAEFAGTIRLAILSDEEGLMAGAKDFVAKGHLDGVDAAIICEPEGGRVCTAQKGALRLHVTIHGKMAHGCMPDEGVNPVAGLGDIIARCRDLERGILTEHELHPLLGRFSLTPTVASAGEPAQANVISNRADLYIDVRTAPQHDHDLIIERVEQMVQKAVSLTSGLSASVQVVDDRPATETPHYEDIVDAVRTEHERVFGNVPPIGGVPGSTDGTIFWAATRLPTVTYGPGDTTIPHQVDEFVRIEEVISSARVYIGAALRFLNDERAS